MHKERERLPALVLGSIYRNVLVDIPTAATLAAAQTALPQAPPPQPQLQPQPPQTQPKAPIRWLGDNKQKIAILVDYEEAVFVPDGTLSLLTNILTACKLSLADVAILNLHKTGGLHYQALFDLVRPERVILFGTGPQALGLPMNFPQFQLQSFSGCVFLCSPTLEAVNEDKLIKSKLWLSLKSLLGI